MSIEGEEEEELIQSNLRQQSEEIEILQSMYDKDFQIEDETPTFSIVVHVGENEGEEATLVVSYNLDYPTKSPPVYHLSVPWLGAEEKGRICAALDEIYLIHIGEPIVYYWVEKFGEMLEEMKPEKLEPLPSKIHVETLNESEDTEGNDDELLLANKLESQEWAAADRDKKSMKGLSPGLPVPQISTGEPLTDRKSTFQAHLASVTSVQEVKIILSELYKIKKIATATHNMYAYRIMKPGTNVCIQDCEDDGETHAGSRLLHLLQILDCRNVMVVVSRWYGGIHLHGDRFKHINNVARILLEKQGFIHAKSSNARQSK